MFLGHAVWKFPHVKNFLSLWKIQKLAAAKRRNLIKIIECVAFFLWRNMCLIFFLLTLSVPMGPESPSEYNLALHSLNARTTYKILMGHLSYLFRIHWNEKIGSYFEKSENINIQLLMIALERAVKIYVYILIGCHNFKPRNFKTFAFQAYFELP